MEKETDTKEYVTLFQILVILMELYSILHLIYLPRSVISSEAAKPARVST